MQISVSGCSSAVSGRRELWCCEPLKHWIQFRQLPLFSLNLMLSEATCNCAIIFHPLWLATSMFILFFTFINMGTKYKSGRMSDLRVQWLHAVSLYCIVFVMEHGTWGASYRYLLRSPPSRRWRTRWAGASWASSACWAAAGSWWTLCCSQELLQSRPSGRVTYK